jgi:2-iminoacetate synthase ThiH
LATYYTDAKVALHLDRLEALRAGDVFAPVHVRLKPTNICDHGCSYCAYRANRANNLNLDGGMEVHDRIAPEKMAELVEDFISMGVEAVTFSGGGEPLL